MRQNTNLSNQASYSQTKGWTSAHNASFESFAGAVSDCPHYSSVSYGKRNAAKWAGWAEGKKNDTNFMGDCACQNQHASLLVTDLFLVQ